MFSKQLTTMNINTDTHTHISETNLPIVPVDEIFFRSSPETHRLNHVDCWSCGSNYVSLESLSRRVGVRRTLYGYACVCGCVNRWRCTHLCVYISLCVLSCACICECGYVCVCVCICMWVWLCVCICVWEYPYLLTMCDYPLLRLLIDLNTFLHYQVYYVYDMEWIWTLITRAG